MQHDNWTNCESRSFDKGDDEKPYYIIPCAGVKLLHEQLSLIRVSQVGQLAYHLDNKNILWDYFKLSCFKMNQLNILNSIFN